MSIYRFTPAMILAAAGSYASAADATVVSQTFNLAFDPVTSQSITIGDSVTPQFTLQGSTGFTIPFDPPTVIPAYQKLSTVPGSYTGSVIASPTIPSSVDGVNGSSTKVFSGASTDQYLQLSFQLDGHTVYGVADFDPNLTLKTISYDDRSGAVPEPAVWMELILGLGLAGTAQRVSRRRRQLATAL